MLLTRIAWSAYLAWHIRGQAEVPFADIATVESMQRRRVRAMIRHAYSTVAYYRETMDRLRLRPEEFQTAADLARLPILERSELQRDPEYFTSASIAPNRRLSVRSGGSTGAPRLVHHDVAAIVQNAAHGERERSIIKRAVGKSFGYRETVIASPRGTAHEVQEFFDRVAMLPRPARIERQYLSMLDPPHRNVPAIAEFDPDVIHSYGSYVGPLFEYARSSGTRFQRLRIVTYSSDGMEDAAERLVTEEIGVPVIGTYQAVEAFKIGFGCGEFAGVHLNTDLYPVRIVDGTGHDVPHGTAGDVVVSNLVNRATVLLNYRLGDLAALVAGACPCGRTLPRLTRPLGRLDDWLVLPDGTRLHGQAVRTIFIDEPRVLQYQVVQHAPDRFTVAIVPMEDCDRDATARRVAANFAGQFGDGVHIELSYVDDLPRTAQGKVRPVISLIDTAGLAAPESATSSVLDRKSHT